mmetsp:Transcript_47108/g.134914  ORF Transcript_47108/g.134914 Transcript_47108/m.134914 type:complete len:211 (+) Transcript_47108:575-1207(+)
MLPQTGHCQSTAGCNQPGQPKLPERPGITRSAVQGSPVQAPRAERAAPATRQATARLLFFVKPCKRAANIAHPPYHTPMKRVSREGKANCKSGASATQSRKPMSLSSRRATHLSNPAAQRKVPSLLRTNCISKVELLPPTPHGSRPSFPTPSPLELPTMAMHSVGEASSRMGPMPHARKRMLGAELLLVQLPKERSRPITPPARRHKFGI